MSNLQQYRKNVLYSTSGPEDFYAPPASPDGKDQLEQIIDLLYKEKWVILSVFVLVVALFGAYAYTQETVYEASSLVMISRENPTLSASSGMLPVGGNMQWGRSPSTELTLLRSSSELPRLVTERLFALQAEDTPGVEPLLTTPEGEALSEAQVARRVRSRIGFGATDDGLIQFRAVTSSSAAASALLANLYAEEYVALTQRVSRAGMVASREFLENQLGSKEDELRAVERQIQEYLSQRGAVSIDAEGSRLMGQVSQMEARRDQIEIELQRREASVEALRSRLRELQPRLAQSLSSTVSQDIELVQQKIAQLKTTRQEAIVQHPEWENPDRQPELQEINSQIERLQETVQALSEQYVNEVVSAGGGTDSTSGGGLEQASALQQQIASEQIVMTGLRAELIALDDYVQGYRANLQEIPGESIQFERLQRERARIEQTYSFISQRLQEIRLSEQGELGYASIIAEASRGSANQPQKERLLILGAFLGLLLGMGAALLRNKFDNRIFKPDEVEARGYNVTIVPDLRDLLKSEYKGQALIERDGREVSTSLVTLHTATSYATEAYRQLRTNLQFSLSDRSSSVIVVTSAGIGEGKSTTASNLAVAFARAGNRTLLIDADMRRPQIHNFFGLSLEPGLHQLLSERAEVMAQNMETGVENLNVVTAGRVSGGDASELVGSRRMQELLGVVRERFDVIIIDTPPALAVTEAKILAPKANATLLVTRAGETKEKELDHAAHELERVGASIVGVVLNGFNIDMAYSYRYRYRDYSAYGHYGQYAQKPS